VLALALCSVLYGHLFSQPSRDFLGGNKVFFCQFWWEIEREKMVGME
jgi:hypothetical protein